MAAQKGINTKGIIALIPSQPLSLLCPFPCKRRDKSNYPFCVPSLASEGIQQRTKQKEYNPFKEYQPCISPFFEGTHAFFCINTRYTALEKENKENKENNASEKHKAL